MTNDEIIEVVAAATAGKQIQWKYKARSGGWSNTGKPAWDFQDYEYRVEPEPLVLFVNVYEEGFVVHETQADADEGTTIHRIRCVKMREVYDA